MKRQRSGASKAKRPTTQDKPGEPEIVRKVTLTRRAAGRSDGKSERLGIVPFPNKPTGEPPYEVFAIRNHVLEMPDASSLRLFAAYAVGNRSLSVAVQHGQTEVFSSGTNWTDASPQFGFLLGNGDRIDLYFTAEPRIEERIELPRGWNKTIDDLNAEMMRGERLGASGEEVDWAREYERSLLPADIVFPEEGEVWETIDDCDVKYGTLFAAPSSGGGNARLQRGERVRILQLPDGRPIMIAFSPLRYDELHTLIVPEEDRNCATYTGYHLWTKTVHFLAHFRRIA